MTKRAALFAERQPIESVKPTPAPVESEPTTLGRARTIAKTREGKRVATVYLSAEALKQLKAIALDEDATLQELLVEGINAVFEKRHKSRIA
jgi:hypothetical protein